MITTMRMITTPPSTTTTRMAETLQADALLTLVQMLSPSYPVGAFAYSHGLEWAVQDGAVADQDALADWLSSVLRHGAGQADALSSRRPIARMTRQRSTRRPAPLPPLPNG